MTSGSSRTPTNHHRRYGLRFRLWLAVLAGPLAAILVSGSVVAAVVMAGTALDPMTVVQAIGAACLAGLAVAILTGAWLTHGIAVRLRDLEEGISRGHLPESRRDRGWGEIGDIARGVRSLLETDRDLREDEAELRSLHAAIDHARDRVERWIREERWELLTPGSGELAPLADSLDRGIARLSEVQHQNLEASHQAHAELLEVIEEASGSAELAEHGYVEVTALLTTIREISRLTTEIQQATQAPAPPEPAVARTGEIEWREQAARAIEELVEVSGESVQRLGEGLLKVREINEQVQLMSNRATLIALNAVVAGRSEARAAASEASNAELKQLAREVRAATERVIALSSEIDRAVEAANEHMREVRDHVVARLVELPAPPPAVAGAAPPPLVGHWIERLREMVQDAARKGERLSESQERVSSAVQRVSRKLQDDVLDLEGLVARLTPMGSTSSAARPPQARDAAKSRLLKLLESEGESPRRKDPTAGEEGGA